MDPKIRSELAVTRELTYVDTAYDGPYPLPVLEAGREFLHEDGIVTSVNLGRELRISPHFFNTEEEIDHLLSVLQAGL